MVEMTFKQLRERRKAAEDLAAAISDGAFITAGEFAERMSKAEDVFYLIAAHELLTEFLAGNNGGHYCRNFGFNLPETSFVAIWARGVHEKISKFAAGDETKAVFVKAALLELLVKKGTASVEAEFDSIPRMDKSAKPEPARSKVRAA